MMELLCEVTMAGIPLSVATRRIVKILFKNEDVLSATRLLVNECGNNLPLLENFDSVKLERFRFAALKLSRGDLNSLRRAIDLAKTDWRDLLMSADFGHDIHAHEKWMPEQRK